MSQFQNTCILYFTTGNTGTKCFSFQKKKNIAIQKTLFAKTLSEIRQSGIAHVISEGKGLGTNFETRIKSAADLLFRKGFQNIIIVGDDTPQLSAYKLLLAAKQLEQSIISIGPSYDGGSYLIALNKVHFEKGLFNNLDWQTDGFHQSLLAQIKILDFSQSILPMLSDIDHAGDLFDFLKQSSIGKTEIILNNLLYRLFCPAFKSKFIEQVTILTHRDRGPPPRSFHFS